MRLLAPPAAQRASVVLGVLSLLCFSDRAAAAGPRQRPLRDTVHVHPGVTCLDESALHDQVRAWLGADAVEAELRVEVVGSGRDGRIVSFRMWRGDRLIAERTFAPGPADCAQMHAAVGLAMALALKVSLRDELFAESLSAPAAGWSLGAGATAAWNVVPGVAGGVLVWLEKALPEHFAVRLALSGLAGGGNEFERVPGKFTTASAALEVGACAVPTFGGGVRGRFCTGLEARGLLASGSGFAVSKDTVLQWFSVSNSAGLAVELTPGWSLLGTVGLVVPLQRVQVAVTEPGGKALETRDLSPAGGQICLGAVYEF